MLPVTSRCLQIISSSYKGFFFSGTSKDVHCSVMKQSQNMSSLPDEPSNRLVWVDMEMTGLNTDVDHILEIACIVTDGDLNIVAEGPDLVLKQTPDVLSQMNDWCLKHHTESGLVKASIASQISVEEAEERVLSFVEAYTPQGKCPLAGNSIYGDKLFIEKFMPRLHSHLHYRMVDVSTIKELCRRWFPDEYNKAPKKIFAHRSLSDIKESIKELQFYKSTIFGGPSDVLLGDGFCSV